MGEVMTKFGQTILKRLREFTKALEAGEDLSTRFTCHRLSFGDLAMQNDWWVYSTAVEDHLILVQCHRTGTRGVVQNPTAEEWAKAFYAPSEPYPWMDHDRVIKDDLIEA